MNKVGSHITTKVRRLLMSTNWFAVINISLCTARNTIHLVYRKSSDHVIKFNTLCILFKIRPLFITKLPRHYKQLQCSFCIP